MELWQMDIMGGVRLKDGSELKIVTGLDDHSRFCVSALVVFRATAKPVCEALALALALRRYGVPEQILTACYESFVNSPHGLSGRWASNRVKDPGWSARRLPIVPHPDSYARGSEGGQAVFVGSVHPKTGKPYRWAEGCSPSEVEIAPLPRSIIERLACPLNNGSTGDGCTPYGLAALERELHVLRRTPEGSRNTELNRAAFVLGQLIAGGDFNTWIFIRQSYLDGMMANRGLFRVELDYDIRETKLDHVYVRGVNVESAKLLPGVDVDVLAPSTRAAEFIEQHVQRVHVELYRRCLHGR